MSENVEKCPLNVQRLSGRAENTIFGHFLGNFCLLVDAFVWWPYPMVVARFNLGVARFELHDSESPDSRFRP